MLPEPIAKPKNAADSSLLIPTGMKKKEIKEEKEEF